MVWRHLILGVVMIAALTACGTDLDTATERAFSHDPESRQTREDFKSLFEPPETDADTPTADAVEPPVPELFPVLSAPAPPPLPEAARVSIQVTEEVPLKDVLFELARQAEIDIEIDPRITGGIVFSARDRPFLEIIDRISRLAGLRYEAADNRILIEIDEPFMRNYSVKYIVQVRNTRGNVGIETEVVSPADGSEVGTGDSSVEISTTSDADFFTELREALTQLVNTTQPFGLATQLAGETTPVIIHRQAGLVSVFANSRQHKIVEDYLSSLREAVNAQVLIEAKIVEVFLDEEFQTGINWRAVFGDDQLVNVATSLGPQVAFPPFSAFGTATPGVTSFAVDGDDVGAIVNFLERFGTTRTLSSPRLTVLNNQVAILKSATNEVFFDIEVTQNRNDAGIITETTVETEINTVPIGLVMAVEASIDPITDEITLTLRPTITRVSGEVPNPGVAIETDGQFESLVPEIDVQELDSVVRLQSGEIAVLGGLLRTEFLNADEGVPVLSRVPLVGNLFKSRNEDTEVSELVVLIRAVSQRAPRPDAADKRLFRDFTQDPRPFTF